MRIEERQKIAEDLFKKCKEILLKKGKDYSSQEDCLSNFKRNAERLGLTKYQVWLVYFMKHIDSICNSIKYSPEYPQVESEPLEGRIIDVINYAVILASLLKEDKNKKENIINHID